MGRIKTALIKRNTLKLLNATDHTTDFDKNKKIVREHMKVSQKIRNSIAGYAVRIKRQEEKKAIKGAKENKDY